MSLDKQEELIEKEMIKSCFSTSIDIIGSAILGPIWSIKELVKCSYSSAKQIAFNDFLLGIYKNLYNLLKKKFSSAIAFPISVSYLLLDLLKERHLSLMQTQHLYVRTILTFQTYIVKFFFISNNRNGYFCLRMICLRNDYLSMIFIYVF